MYVFVFVCMIILSTQQPCYCHLHSIGEEIEAQRVQLKWQLASGSVRLETMVF